MNATDGRLGELRAAREEMVRLYYQWLRGEITAREANRATREISRRVLPKGAPGIKKLRAQVARMEAELAARLAAARAGTRDS